MNANTWILDKPLGYTRSTGVMALGSVLFAALTAMGAAVSFPLFFSPVPVTLQTLFVVLAGAVLGPVWGPASQLLYIGAGIAGMPVFAQGLAGPGVLAGPTGGYLAGFVVGAWVAGLLTRTGASWPRLLVGLTLAHLAIFICGVSHLRLFTAQSLTGALSLGFYPFLPGLAVKVVAGAGFLRSRKLTGWFRH